MAVASLIRVAFARCVLVIPDNAGIRGLVAIGPVAVGAAASATRMTSNRAALETAPSGDDVATRPA